MKAKEPTRPILDRKKLREKSYGPEYSPVFRRRNVARGPVKEGLPAVHDFDE